jgi:DNA-directed RNA polymerase subunit RPC12/RpoP
MLYTNPAYTSTTCPKCGWRKMLKFPTTLTKSSIQKFFQDISLHYDGKRFVFSYTIEDTAFALYSDVERTLWDNRNRETKHYRDITRDITLALQKVGIEMKGNILSELDQREVSLDTLKSILFAFKLINSIRNNDSKNKEDIISCPSCHYNSKD